MTTPSQGPELRIGDAEREAAISALGEHYAAGRLTKEEYDERSAHAYAARTRSALWPLFADLPRAEPEPSGPPGGQRPGEDRRGRPGWPLGIPMVPVLLVALVISILVGHPVVLFVLLAFLVVRMLRSWGRPPRHHHHHHGTGWR